MSRHGDAAAAFDDDDYIKFIQSLFPQSHPPSALS